MIGSSWELYFNWVEEIMENSQNYFVCFVSGSTIATNSWRCSSTSSIKSSTRGSAIRTWRTRLELTKQTSGGGERKRQQTCTKRYQGSRLTRQSPASALRPPTKPSRVPFKCEISPKNQFEISHVPAIERTFWSKVFHLVCSKTWTLG